MSPRFSPAVEPPCATISRQRPLILRILGGLLRREIQLYLENIVQQNKVLVSEKLSWSIVSGYEYLWLRKDRREDATVFIFGEYWFACILSQIDATLQEFRMHLPWIAQLITRKQPDWTGNWTSSPRRMSAIQRCFCFVFFFSVWVWALANPPLSHFTVFLFSVTVLPLPIAPAPSWRYFYSASNKNATISRGYLFRFDLFETGLRVHSSKVLVTFRAWNQMFQWKSRE